MGCQMHVLTPGIQPTGKPVHSWSKLYWPVGLVVALLAFFVPFLSGASLTATGLGLLSGALILGVPELIALVTWNDQDTLSDWMWRNLRIVHDQAPNLWSARQILPLGGYLLVVGCVQFYLFELAQAHGQFWLLFLAGVFFFGVWLLLHFFERWWA